MARQFIIQFRPEPVIMKTKQSPNTFYIVCSKYERSRLESWPGLSKTLKWEVAFSSPSIQHLEI